MSKLFNYLQSNSGAIVDAGVIEHFGRPFEEYASAVATSGKSLLHSLGIVRFSGVDARSFINGQCTTNCEELTTHTSQLSGWCDPKGRVLYLFVLFSDGENIFAILPTTQIERFASRMRMYVMRADVTLDEVTADYDILGVTGSTASATVANVAWQVEISTQGHFLLRYGSGPVRFLHIVRAHEARDYFDAIDALAVGEQAWRALDSIAGIPRIDTQSSGQYLPQNLNLDCMDALSFSKGCYPGQEIIARLKYRGKVKKRLISGTCSWHESLKPQTPIHVDGSIVGHVLFATAISTQHALLSAITEVEANPVNFCIEGIDKLAFVACELPYSVPP